MSLDIQTKACCTCPPITLRGGYDYVEKGEYINFNGMKTYVTGNPKATRGIFLFYDVFGLFVQAIKGADILAFGSSQTPDDAGEFKVFMPDFWGEHPQDLANFPPKTPKQRKAVVDFMTGPANPKKNLPLAGPPYIRIWFNLSKNEILLRRLNPRSVYWDKRTIGFYVTTSTVSSTLFIRNPIFIIWPGINLTAFCFAVHGL